MKSTGIVRKVDELGRIVLPVELRRQLRIKASKNKAESTALEIYVDGDKIVLGKYEPACIFCGEAKEVVNYKGKNICKSCIKEIISKFKKEDDDICKIEESIWKTLK
mgnify:CR=1 FL=1